jgi:guanosine-3',5'-bis(diphosphate) 3'-pyrophosphohydrolase
VTGIASPPLAAAVDRSPLVADALAAAREAHAGQVRNGSGGMPYIEHPQAVAALLAEHGFADEILAASLLHDVVEDSETMVEDLRERFGEPVAGLVAALSDDETIEDYRKRKDEHRERIREADGDAFAIYGADKLTNVRTLRRAYGDEGERVRDEFKVPLELKLDVWDGDREMLESEAPELPFLDQLSLELSRLREDLAAAAPPRGT